MPAALKMATAKHRPARRAPSTVWLSPQQAAQQLGVHVNTIYAACGKGLKHAKLGHSTIRIRPAWLDEWMESRAS